MTDEPTINRHCPFCQGVTACRVHDSDKSRAYECQHCLAVEWITKGGTSWWYHGWQSLDEEDRPGLRIDGDGSRKSAPIRFMEWASMATEGNLDALNS